MTSSRDATPELATNSLPVLDGIAYIELWVGNAQQAAHFYCSTFGFTTTAYAGPETGMGDRVSYLIQQGDIRLVFSSAISSDHPIAEHVHRHGDSVRDIALAVGSADRACEQALRYGGQVLAAPADFAAQAGHIRRAQIQLYGDTVHTLIQPDPLTGSFFPHYQPLAQRAPSAEIGLISIDHVAICVERGDLERVIGFYTQAFGFQQLHEETVETEFSSMNSKAIEGGSGRIKFVVMEPAPSKRISQIEQYLSAHAGPGAQHIATRTNDIVATIRALRANGITFRSTPGAYYDMLTSRVGDLPNDIGDLRELHILADRDQWGYLLQIFARPIQARPTLFFEIIQREGARGFGSGNIKALFESIEREELRRQ